MAQVSRGKQQDAPPPIISSRSTRASRLRMLAISSENAKQKTSLNGIPGPGLGNARNSIRYIENGHTSATQKVIEMPKKKICKKKVGGLPEECGNDGGLEKTSEPDSAESEFGGKKQQGPKATRTSLLRRPQIPQVLQQKNDKGKVPSLAATKPEQRQPEQTIIHFSMKETCASKLSFSTTTVDDLCSLTSGSDSLPSSDQVSSTVAFVTTPPPVDPRPSCHKSAHSLPSCSTTNDQTSASPAANTYHSSNLSPVTLGKTECCGVKAKTKFWTSLSHGIKTTRALSTNESSSSLEKKNTSFQPHPDSSKNSQQKVVKKGARVSSILKKKPMVISSNSEVPPTCTAASIPDKKSVLMGKLQPHSILKKKDSLEEKKAKVVSCPSRRPGLHSILKKHSSEEEERRSSSPDIHPILKKPNEDPAVPNGRKPILKKRSSLSDEPLMSNFQDLPRPILKKKSNIEEKPRPILKSKRSEEEWLEDFTSSRPRANSSDTGIRSILKKGGASHEPASVKLDPAALHNEASAANQQHPRRVSLESGLISSKIPSEPFCVIVENSPDVKPSSSPSSAEEEPSCLSLPDRMSIFRNLEGSRRRHRQGSRYQTQPITLEELSKATSSLPQNDPSRLSVKEKLKLFDGQHKAAQQLGERRKTQPITLMEIKQAQALSSQNTSKTNTDPRKIPVRSPSPSLQCQGDSVDGAKLCRQPAPSSSEKVSEISNAAVRRRFNASLRRRQEARVCISLDGESSCPKVSNETPMERPRFFTDSILLENSRSEGIAERLSQLSKNCDEKWKQRVSQLKSNDQSVAEEALSARMSRLEKSREQWKDRVQEKDTAQFTVAGKLGASQATPSHPHRASLCIPPLPSQPLTLSSSSVSMSSKQVLVSSSSTLTNISSSQVFHTTAHHQVTTTSFGLLESTVNRVQNEEEILGTFNLEDLGPSQQPLTCLRKAAPSRRAPSRNPLRALAIRSDLLDPQTVAAATIRNGLAPAALAGLASREDFSAVELRRAKCAEPLLPQMLLQVKGRRRVQIRLVEPCLASINPGDNYVLVTPQRVFNFTGDFANIIEVSKGAEVAAAIQSHKDLCFTGSAEVVTVSNPEASPDMFRHLGFSGDPKAIQDAMAPPALPEEDEIYEQSVVDTTMVYKVEGEGALVPHPTAWGVQPTFNMLDPSQVLVFDFGSEMYVWHGKLASPALRKTALLLARELWDRGYDYTACGVNPMHSRLEGPLASSQRPSWALFAKINQHMEPVLFREKFADWPDTNGRLITVKRLPGECINEDPKQVKALVACDGVALARSSRPPESKLVLEGLSLGRGHSLPRLQLTTLGLTTWLATGELGHTLLEPRWSGILFFGEAYIFRWHYHTATIARDLQGNVSKRPPTGGRKKWAYCFWQGQESSANERGLSALATVALDQERGPHVRVAQGREPPCFLSLFSGGLLQLAGRRPAPGSIPECRLLMVRGENPEEAHLLEVVCHGSSLRSCGAFVLLQQDRVMVWHGRHVPAHHQTVTTRALDQLRDHIMSGQLPELLPPPGCPFIHLDEGAESDSFWEALHSSSPADYCPLPQGYFEAALHQPRLFHLSSLSGNFTATEVVGSQWTPAALFPFLQEDLYSLPSQPALCLVDSGSGTVYLWQGWWPEEVAGWAPLRWRAEWRCGLETAMQYGEERGAQACVQVWAGMEPPSFKALFPTWRERPDIAELQPGRQPGEMVELSQLLPQLTRSLYTLEELHDAPGVDPRCLEAYLPPPDFQELLGVAKEDFYQLPLWKQIKLKQAAGLF